MYETKENYYSKISGRSSKSLNKKLTRFGNDGRKVVPKLTRSNRFVNIKNLSSHEVYAVY